MPGRWRRIRAAVLNNKQIKLLSLLLAIIAWFAIRETISERRQMSEIPFEILVADGMAVLEQSVNTVEVTFLGSREDIERLDRSQLRAVVDLRNQHAADEIQLPLSPANIRGGRGARAIEIWPSRVAFTLDREEEKLVPVKARHVGQPLLGEVERSACNPAAVFLRGPAGRLAVTDQLFTEPVDVDGRVESFMKRVAVQFPGESSVYEIEPAVVEVQVTIVRHSTKRDFPDVPVAVMTTPDSRFVVEVEPALVTVSLQGGPAELEAIDAAALSALVDCRTLEMPATYDLPVKVHVARRGDIQSRVEPASVKVVVRER